MLIRKNTSLKFYNTFGLDYMANSIVHIRTDKEAIALFKGGTSLKKPLLILGEGSNVLFTNDFKGTIIRPEYRGIKIGNQDNDTVIISAGAGIIWDKLVEWTVNRGFGGLENLSLIPGFTGAAAVQNIGAYGTEVKDTIYKLKTISVRDGSVRIFNKEECKFGYRSSIFKTTQKGKFLVTRVYFKLSVNPLLNLEYGSLKDEVMRLGKNTLTNARQAVINIRRNKLPDPEVIGNAGSFFKNPVVTSDFAERLKKRFPGICCYNDPSGGIKLAAAWLIEYCGWKGKRIGDAGVHDKQALVLVNYGKASGRDILDLSEQIRKSVFEKFGIGLEKEVEVIGTP